jgi:hypothetical protein
MTVQVFIFVLKFFGCLSVLLQLPVYALLMLFAIWQYGLLSLDFTNKCLFSSQG